MKDKIQNHTIGLEHIRTKDMLADADERLTTQCVQGTLSRYGFKGKPMISGSLEAQKNIICFKIERYVVAV